MKKRENVKSVLKMDLIAKFSRRQIKALPTIRKNRKSFCLNCIYLLEVCHCWKCSNSLYIIGLSSLIYLTYGTYFYGTIILLYWNDNDSESKKVVVEGRL